MNENKLGLNWSAVEKALAEGTFSGYKIGILETEKLFNTLLKEKGIPGRNTEKKIKYIQRFLSLPDKLDYSRNICEAINSETHFEISREETKHVISGYWQAMLDIEEACDSFSYWEKLNLRLRYGSGLFLRNLRNVSIGILCLSTIVWFFGETQWGKKAASVIVVSNHFFIFKFLFWTIIVLASLLAVGSVLYFATTRKKRL